MKKKNAFTLVELLAVIAILAILVIVSMPAIMQLFRNARKDSFLNEVRTLLSGAESAFLSEALKNKKISVVASDELLVEIINQDGENRLSGKIDYTGKEMDYYIELDSSGKPSRYIFTDGNFAIFSTSSKGEVQSTEILEEAINIEDYVKEFNIRGPIISTGNTYTREALDFDFKAKDLIGKGPGGSNLNTWTSKSGDVSGTIYQYDSISRTVTPISNPQFVNNALVLQGKQAIRFNAGFNYDDLSAGNSDSYGSFTLEATVNFDKFHPVSANYTNIISNIETGGYYLNVYSEKQNAIKGKPGIGVFLGGNYRQCHSPEEIHINKTYVLTATFDLRTNTTKVYVDGELKKTCQHNTSWKFSYPAQKTPLSVGGNPAPNTSGYFTDTEWVYGKIYTARIYQGVMNQKEIYMNYLSNYIYANDLSENSSIINLTVQDETVEIEKYQYSLDNGQTWMDYNFNAAPLVTQDTYVSARAISKLGVVSPVTSEWIYID